jgi:hypothetical protein
MAVVVVVALLRWGYQVTHDPDVRRRSARRSWWLAATAVVLALIGFGAAPAGHAP